jgi:hypothetical protein
MRGVLAAPAAELLQLEPVWVVLLVLGGGVVAFLALVALQGDDRRWQFEISPEKKRT